MTKAIFFLTKFIFFLTKTVFFMKKTVFVRKKMVSLVPLRDLNLNYLGVMRFQRGAHLLLLNDEWNPITEFSIFQNRNIVSAAMQPVYI